MVVTGSGLIPVSDCFRDELSKPRPPDYLYANYGSEYICVTYMSLGIFCRKKSQKRTEFIPTM